MARETSPPMSGAFRLFRLGGIAVHLHWSWLLVAAFSVQYRAEKYDTKAWALAEYLSLFAIVLMHEFGHALACRSVGGKAEHIVLWPLGGVAFVQPPARPGAVLWSIAAGPLVNVVLVPVTFGAVFLAAAVGLPDSGDAFHFLSYLALLNLFLLGFNLLPVYPLDGGQIVQAVLWFFIGRARSLLIVSVIGLVVGLGVVGVALVKEELWFVILAGFVALQSFNGFRQARLLARVDAVRRPEAACPACGAHPPAVALWECGGCRTQFDTFATGAECPQCHALFSVTACPECKKANPIGSWYAAADRERDRVRGR